MALAISFPRQAETYPNIVWPTKQTVLGFSQVVFTTSAKAAMFIFDAAVTLVALANLVLVPIDLFTTVVILKIQPFGGLWEETSYIPRLAMEWFGFNGLYLVAGTFLAVTFVGLLVTGLPARRLTKMFRPPPSVLWSTLWQVGSSIVRIEAGGFFLWFLDPKGLPIWVGNVILPQIQLSAQAILWTFGLI